MGVDVCVCVLKIKRGRGGGEYRTVGTVQHSRSSFIYLVIVSEGSGVGRGMQNLN